MKNLRIKFLILSFIILNSFSLYATGELKEYEDIKQEIIQALNRYKDINVKLADDQCTMNKIKDFLALADTKKHNEIVCENQLLSTLTLETPFTIPTRPIYEFEDPAMIIDIITNEYEKLIGNSELPDSTPVHDYSGSKPTSFIARDTCGGIYAGDIYIKHGKITKNKQTGEITSECTIPLNGVCKDKNLVFILSGRAKKSKLILDNRGEQIYEAKTIFSQIHESCEPKYRKINTEFKTQ